MAVDAAERPGSALAVGERLVVETDPDERVGAVRAVRDRGSRTAGPQTLVVDPAVRRRGLGKTAVRV